MTDPNARQAEAMAAEDATAAETGDLVVEAKREAAEFKDKLLRTLAEMENLRKRTEREVLDARVYGIAGFARDVLAVADNMHRALEAIGADLREAADPKVKALIEGVELTERELMKILEKNGGEILATGREVRSELPSSNVRSADARSASWTGGPGHSSRLYDGDRVLCVRLLWRSAKPLRRRRHPPMTTRGRPNKSQRKATPSRTVRKRVNA